MNFKEWFYKIAVPRACSQPKEPKEHVFNKYGVCEDCGIIKLEYTKIKPAFKALPCGSFHVISMKTHYCKQCGLPKWYLMAHWNMISICPGIIDISDCPIDLIL